MISGNIDSLRTMLHLLAVTVWVGGQVVLGGLVPVLRREAPEALPKVARAFARLAWPAMLVIVLTGAWSLAAVDATERRTEWVVTLAVKLILVGLAVVSTIVHSLARDKRLLALGGAMALVASLAAMYMGVLLAHVG